MPETGKEKPQQGADSAKNSKKRIPDFDLEAKSLEAIRRLFKNAQTIRKERLRDHDLESPDSSIEENLQKIK